MSVSADMLIRYIQDVVDSQLQYAIENNKKVIIWGYAKGGRYLKKIIEQSRYDVEVSYIIDLKKDNVYGSNIVINRPTVLNYIDADRYIVFSTVADFENVVYVIEEEFAYKKIELVNMREKIGNSYLEYLHFGNPILDFSREEKTEYEEYAEDENWHEPCTMASMNDILSEMDSLMDGNVGFFDVGCGKGAAICYAYFNGIRCLGGVELIGKLYEQAKTNLSEIGIEAEIVNQSALEVGEILDKYNCFFMYNPFNGEIFEKFVICLNESFERKPRKMCIIYGNPFSHLKLEEDGKFKLVNQMVVDMYDPLCNVYVRDVEQ